MKTRTRYGHDVTLLSEPAPEDTELEAGAGPAIYRIETLKKGFRAHGNTRAVWVTGPIAVEGSNLGRLVEGIKQTYSRYFDSDSVFPISGVIVVMER